MTIKNLYYKMIKEEDLKELPTSVICQKDLFVTINTEHDLEMVKKHNCQLYIVHVSDDIVRIGILVPKAVLFDHAYTK